MIWTEPRTVAELVATSTEWTVQHGTEYGRWLTAERVIERDGRKWRLGLTPVGAAVVALLVWLGDDELVEHTRGTEAQMCALAHRKAAELARA
ncbi:hypothetical protein [Lentzea sp. NPDC051838]|uniref:hypothetical protein n=1 Tax=Lentzea sp. NPDC051838 TaxID=3154849 RepID=UPI00343604C7